MKKKRLNALAAAVIGMSMIGWAQAAETDTQPASAAPGSPTQAAPSDYSNPSAPASMNQSHAPASNWTELKGQVASIDLQNQKLQIQESGTQTLFEVPITKNV